jgi:hypothetical protein
MIPSLRAKRSNPSGDKENMDCFVATPLAMTAGTIVRTHMNQSEFLTATLRNPTNEFIAAQLFELALPDAWIVSGCLVQTVWNVLTGRATVTASTITTCSISIPIRRGKPKTP